MRLLETLHNHQPQTTQTSLSLNTDAASEDTHEDCAIQTYPTNMTKNGEERNYLILGKEQRHFYQRSEKHMQIFYQVG